MHIEECYVRGTTIKYLVLPNDLLHKVPDENLETKGRKFDIMHFFMKIY